MRRTASRSFRNAIQAEYPWLDEKVGYWRLIQIAIFGMPDRETGDPVVSQRALAKAEAF